MRAATGAVVSAALTVLCASGCATAARQQPAEGGRVTIGITTAGATPGMTFRVTIEPAGIAATVKADAGVLTRGGIAPGDHLVRLGDVPARCRIEGGPERTITISPQRRSAVVRFAVDCG
jgi:hypothetical protein